jgi:hypothetical protein
LRLPIIRHRAAHISFAQPDVFELLEQFEVGQKQIGDVFRVQHQITIRQRDLSIVEAFLECENVREAHTFAPRRCCPGGGHDRRVGGIGRR